MITETDYIEIIEMYIKNKYVINKTTWKYLSEHMNIKFIEKYIDNFNLNIKALCKNKTITIDFIKKYLHLFEKDNIMSQLSNKIKISYKEITQDSHVTLTNRCTYKNIEYYNFKFNYNDDKLICDNGHNIEYKLCEFYEKWFKEYNPKNNYYNCESCGDDNYIDSCYQMIHNLYNTPLHKEYCLIKKDTLHLVELKYIKQAIDILNEECIFTKSRDDNFIKLLYQNKSLSFKDKYNTKDLIDWNWDYIVSNSNEYILVKDMLQNEEDNQHYLYDFNESFLDGIIDKDINQKFFYDKLMNLNNDGKQLLKKYNKIDLLLITLIQNDNDKDSYYINDLIEYVSLNSIK